MAQGGIEVRGLAELARAMRRFPDELEQDLGPVKDRAAQAAASRARAVVPRRSGALASSVAAEEAAVGMGEGLAYGGWIEYGGSRGRPYVASGRYVLPSALTVQESFTEDAARQASTTIGRFPWPRAPL